MVRDAPGSTIDTGLFFQSCCANTVSTPRWSGLQSFRTRATSASDQAAYCVSDSTRLEPGLGRQFKLLIDRSLSISSIRWS